MKDWISRLQKSINFEWSQSLINEFRKHISLTLSHTSSIQLFKSKSDVLNMLIFSQATQVLLQFLSNFAREN